MAYFKYQVPSLAGTPQIPPVMASFQEGRYRHNGLRGLSDDSKRRLSGTALAVMLAAGVGLFVLLKDD